MERILSEFGHLYFNGGLLESDRRVISMFAEWWERGGRGLLAGLADLGAAEEVVLDFEEFAEASADIVGDFGACLRDQPQRVLGHLGLSLVVFREFLLGGRQPPGTRPIEVRFTNLLPALPFTMLKSSIVGKFVSITGYVVRCSSIQPMVTQASFECPKCGSMIRQGFEDGKFAPPSRCEDRQCRAKVFELRRETAVTVSRPCELTVAIRSPAHSHAHNV